MEAALRETDRAIAELGAVGLAQRGLHVRHREGGNEPGETVGMPPDQLGHAVIADACELGTLPRLREVLDGWIGQCHDLAVVAQGIHATEAVVEVVQLAHLLQPFDQPEAGAAALQRGREIARQDVGEDVDDHRLIP
jgi:hypothetical protein